MPIGSSVASLGTGIWVLRWTEKQDPAWLRVLVETSHHQLNVDIDQELLHQGRGADLMVSGGRSWAKAVCSITAAIRVFSWQFMVLQERVNILIALVLSSGWLIHLKLGQRCHKLGRLDQHSAWKCGYVIYLYSLMKKLFLFLFLILQHVAGTITRQLS